MQLLIFGATGATGHQLVRQALEQGHAVTAFVRDPARLRISHALLRHVVGDAMNAASVAGVVAGHDAVLCALGNMPEGKEDLVRRQRGVPVCSVGTGHIVAAMARSSVRRIVVESSAGVGESRAAGQFGSSFVLHLLLGDVMADKERQEALMRGSALDWTIVRPAKLNNRPAMGRLRSGDSLSWNLTSSASRADVAAFMLARLADTSTKGRAITVLD